MRVLIAGLVLVAVVFAFDYYVDYPKWFSMPEMWTCGRTIENNFDFCR